MAGKTADNRVIKYGRVWPNKPWGPKNRIIPCPDWYIELCILRDYERMKSLPGNKLVSWQQHFVNFTKIIFGDPRGIFYFEWNPNAMRILDNFYRHNILAIAGHKSSGKCLAPHTKVRMFDGSSKRADQIVVGDLLAGDSNDARTVLSTCTGRSNMVRIVPKSGEPWECNDDHVLTLQRTCKNVSSNAKVGEIIDIPVKEFLKKPTSFQIHHRLFVRGMDFPDQEVEIDPRVYGIWLGDGGCNKPSITIPDAESEVQSYVFNYFEQIGYVRNEGRYRNRCPSPSFGKKGDNPWLRLVRESSGCKNAEEKGHKRILKKYLLNSRQKRMELLAGIIDSDGHAAGTHFSISCSNPTLAEDICFLARSLGFRATKTFKLARCNGKEFPSERINILGDVCSIPTLRKKCQPKKLRHHSECIGFKIEQLGQGQYNGFTLDGNGRFLLEDFTVTHNTESLALIGAMWFFLFPKDTKVIVTSTTVAAAKDKVWGKIKLIWIHLEKYFGTNLMPGRLIDSQNRIRYEFQGVKSETRGIVLLASESSSEKESADKLQGTKAERMIVMGDEFATLKHSLLNTVLNNLTANKQCKLAGAFNPNSYYDPGGIISRPKGGWSTITEDDIEWETEIEPFGLKGYCIRFDGEKSPNVLAGHERWKGLLTLEKLRQIGPIGTKTKGYYEQIRGLWSPAGDLDSIYTETEIVKYGADRPVTTWVEPPVMVAALDPGFVHGGDRAALAIGKSGIAVNVDTQTKQKVFELTHIYVLDDDITNKTVSKVEWVVKLTKEKLAEHKVDIRNFAIDATGGGEPFSALIARDIGLGFINVCFSGRASDMPVSRNDHRKGSERFFNMASELWYVGRELVRTGQLRGLKPDVVAELCARTYKEKANVVQIESKKDMRLRTKKSPDLGDSALMCLYVSRVRHGLSSNEKAAIVLRPRQGMSEFDLGFLTKKQTQSMLPDSRLISFGGGWAQQI